MKKKTKKLPYPFTIRPLLPEEGGGYLIEFPDLPGCMSDGETPEEAIANGKDAMEGWLDCARKFRDAIPKPSIPQSESRYSGRVLQRLPKTLHAKLALRAKREGVSLNQLILSLVAEGLGRREAR
jgi:antitoxin HicB